MVGGKQSRDLPSGEDTKTQPPAAFNSQGLPIPSRMGGASAPTPHIPQEPSCLPDALLTQSLASMCRTAISGCQSATTQPTRSWQEGQLGKEGDMTGTFQRPLLMLVISGALPSGSQTPHYSGYTPSAAGSGCLIQSKNGSPHIRWALGASLQVMAQGQGKGLPHGNATFGLWPDSLGWLSSPRAATGQGQQEASPGSLCEQPGP